LKTGAPRAKTCPHLSKPSVRASRCDVARRNSFQRSVNEAATWANGIVPCISQTTDRGCDHSLATPRRQGYEDGHKLNHAESSSRMAKMMLPFRVVKEIVDQISNSSAHPPQEGIRLNSTLMLNTKAACQPKLACHDYQHPIKAAAMFNCF